VIFRKGFLFVFEIKLKEQQFLNFLRLKIPIIKACSLYFWFFRCLSWRKWICNNSKNSMKYGKNQLKISKSSSPSKKLNCLHNMKVNLLNSMKMQNILNSRRQNIPLKSFNCAVFLKNSIKIKGTQNIDN